MSIVSRPYTAEGECRYNLNFELPKYGAVAPDHRKLPDGSYQIEWQDCLGIQHVTVSASLREAVDQVIATAKKIADGEGREHYVSLEP
jgi:hypothetical protein